MTHARLDVFPDWGRLRINGEIDPVTLDELGRAWRASLPDVHRRAESAPHL